MRDLGIVFSKSMVLALLAGTKTQTRRVLLPGPPRLMCRSCGVSEKQFKGGLCVCASPNFDWTPCDLPRHRVGDRLYVREEIEAWISGDNPAMKYVRLVADGHATLHPWPETWKRDKAIAMHMLRQFSRLTLVVTSVLVQRLQDISDQDAIAEGIDLSKISPENTPRHEYMRLWQTLHHKDAPWLSNPWVCATEFAVHKMNIERMPA